MYYILFFKKNSQTNNVENYLETGQSYLIVIDKKMSSFEHNGLAGGTPSEPPGGIKIINLWVAKFSTQHF